MPEDEKHIPLSSRPSISSTSYVYPVRSLLTGIQPASDIYSGPVSQHIFSSQDVADLLRAESDAPKQTPSPGEGMVWPKDSRIESDSSGPQSNLHPSLDARNEAVSPPESSSSQSSKPNARRRAQSYSRTKPCSSSSSPCATTPPEPPRKHKRHRSTRKQSPNFRHYPGEDNSYFPRTFSTVSPHSAPFQSPSLATLATISGPANELSEPSPAIYSSLHGHYPPPLLVTASGALTATSSSLLPASPTASSSASASPMVTPDKFHREKAFPFEVKTTKMLLSRRNSPHSKPKHEEPPPPQEPEEKQSDPPTSLVTPPTHGSPMRIDSPEKGEASSLPEEKDSDLPFNPSRYGLVHLPPLARSEGGSLPAASRSNSRRPNASVYEDQAEFLVNDLPQVSRSHSVSGSNSNSGSSRSFSGTGDSALSEYMTVKFEHVEDEDGHHVVVGREGKLRRCEDEPIRTPGSVQGFGVLIAVDEQQDALVVRQISENSTELLGLPPRYLFTLECFTDTLPETQADTLWDNIQFLMEPDLAHDEEASPHVFLLSGYGAPGSAAADDKNATRDGKRMWTCWCAVHRAVPVGDKPLNTGLIIMEFELEKDTMNPLYPLIPPESAVGQTGTLNDFADGVSVAGSQSSGQSTVGTVVPPTPSTEGATPSTEDNLSFGFKTLTPVSGLEGDDNWLPTAEDILESTTSRAKPLPALERLRRMNRTGWDPNPDITSPDEGLSRPRRTARRGGRGNTGVGMMDVFAVMGQINEQLGAAPDLDTFLKVVVGVIKDLTQFHRVLVYQFDEMWNGLVVAELVDWSQTHDLYKGLHFPAADIPAQARQLYAVNKVRLLYDRSQPTARLVVRNEDDLDTPLNMTHCYLRAMSPIHIKYLENMGVRASMSVSIVAFDQLWGLVACHSYGSHGMRVSFPVRQILRLLSQSISRNVERLSYARRIHTRKLINTLTSERHPSGYIVSNADDLLALFDADFGILVIGEGAKILGPNQHGQELLIMAEYLRLKQFTTIQASQAVIKDYPDLQLTTGTVDPWFARTTADSRHSSGFEIIAGLLYVPLSSGGKDFIAFLRKGQPREVHWAGKPYKEGHGTKATLEPRTSFKIWSETVAGRCRAWTEEQLETAGVLALVYGKFIEVWRQKESALQTTKLTNILLSNASHEVRTPLNHIINYLEMALNGPLDLETRDNLRLSHAASKSLLFTINDLLDLTRLESGNETSFNEPFDLHFAIEDATTIYRKEANRRSIEFLLDLENSPTVVVGDSKKIRTVVQNLTANALKYTTSGSIKVSCKPFEEPEGLRSSNQTVVEIVVADSGCGIAQEKLDSIFREFEQVESSEPRSTTDAGVGLGLAVVARIIEQLGGQLRVDSKVDEGSRFSFLIPLSLSMEPESERPATPGSQHSSTRSGSMKSIRSEIDELVEALSADHMVPIRSPRQEDPNPMENSISRSMSRHSLAITSLPKKSIKVYESEKCSPGRAIASASSSERQLSVVGPPRRASTPFYTAPILENSSNPSILRVLIVEDNDINRKILAKRLTLSGHTVINTTNGQEGLDKVESDRGFDAVLMDIQMPILNGFEATRRIRDLEKSTVGSPPIKRLSHILNGRIPIFAVSASLFEHQRDELFEHGMDGWILKPIDFKRLNVLLKGVTDPSQRERDVYRPGCNWELGGWLKERPQAS